MIGYEGAARYARLVQALTGDDQIVPPGILLEADRPEYRVLKNEVPWSMTLELVDGVNFPIIGVFCNQPNALTVVQGIQIISLEAAAINVKVGITANLTHDTTGAVGPLDSRRGAPLTKWFKRQQAGDAMPSLGRFAINSGVQMLLPWQVCLVGGSGYELSVERYAAGTTVAASFWGYERTLRPEELTQ